VVVELVKIIFLGVPVVLGLLFLFTLMHSLQHLLLALLAQQHQQVATKKLRSQRLAHLTQ
jgi:hypothetical protein